MSSAPWSLPPTKTFASDLPSGSAMHVVSSRQASNLQSNSCDNGVELVDILHCPLINLKVRGDNEK